MYAVGVGDKVGSTVSTRDGGSVEILVSAGLDASNFSLAF